jgi:hypothetical protein
MTTDERQKTAPAKSREQETEEPTPAWLLANDEALPAELRALYQGLPLKVTQICEKARQSMRSAYVSGLCKAHKALTPHLKFKEWCIAAGINYVTAQSIVQRAEQAANMHGHTGRLDRKKKEADSTDTETDLDSLVDPPPPPNTNRSIKLMWPLAEYEAIVAGLRAVGETIGKNKYEDIVEALVAFWELHYPLEGEVQHAAA